MTHPTTLADQLIDLLEDSIRQFESINEADWSHKERSGQWSKKEILGHLVDSALTNIQRFVRLRQGDQTNLYYDQDFWVQVSDYQHQDMVSITQLWWLLNLQVVRIWKGTAQGDLEKTIPVKDEQPTLQFLMEDYIAHMQHHLGQIVNGKS